MKDRTDPVVEEIRKYRAQHAAEHGYDLKKIFADFRKKEVQTGTALVTRRPRLRLRPTGS